MNTYPNPKAAANRVLVLALFVGLGALVWFSGRLARTRIFQVDECQNVCVARILATGQTKTAYANISLVHFPLSWVAHGGARSIDLFTAARSLMLGIFWLNIVLIALATGEKLLSRRGFLALLAAATLAPLWDYGLEVRHDNLLLTGVLLTWYIVRVRPAGTPSYVMAGALATALQFVAFKAFVYTLPISLAILACPPPGHRARRWKLAVAWIGGALAMLLLLRVLYGAAGLWDLYLADLNRVAGDSTGGTRFAPWDALSRLLGQTPLLLALVAAASVALAADLRTRARDASIWDSSLPEALLLAVATFALLINPAPYPYNLLHLVPYGFLFAYRYAGGLASELASRPALLTLAWAILVSAHLVPFVVATRRHLDWPNARQVCLMNLAEGLTDSEKDPVYDGVGMVPTRPKISYRWYLHSLNIKGFAKGPGPRVHELLAARPAAVVIPNYRTDWLPEQDLDYIREKYVPVADDFWVLGKALSPGGGSFEIVKPGRYRISSIEDSDLGDKCPGVARALVPAAGHQVFTARLDGVAISAGVAELASGTHNLETKSDCQPAVVWVGPQRDRIGRLAPADHRSLFVNWY